ncbi:TetR/AcrR family transcriptional regulator [Paenibacillus sp. CF384]|uniref:TetR/AcrR family transcriptional regulator n=1 Tax=Paenibacillus sp. CF384 TaxID=1884382 RepID=UPI00089922CE|nr:TetR/AcrR family transcriptional regulator [Paenibacillus sp. CF384]SDW70238.1 transcriptional regulator, TetR family [Paenibacillus sp. CF384]
MYPAFAKLPEEKQELIMTICIEEFAKNGYTNTSTDTITARAGISKGILFHYFKSKKNLYLAVVQHAMDLLVEKSISAVEAIGATDFFEHIKEIVLAKQRVTLHYLHETELVQRVISHPPKAVEAEIEKLIQAYQKTFTTPAMLRSIYKAELLDAAPLRDGLDADAVFNHVTFVLNALSNKYLLLHKSHTLAPVTIEQKLMQEIDTFIDMIKYGVYKQDT